MACRNDLADRQATVGLLFLCPLGDIFPRRNFILLLVLFTATVWYEIILSPLQELVIDVF